MPVRRSLLCWLVFVTALACAACSGSGADGLYPVTGKVMYKGQPAKGALVTFHPKGADPIKAIRPIGVVNESGVFTLQTGSKEGAAPGEYGVTLIWPEDVGKGLKKGISTGEQPESRDRLNGAYSTFAAPPFKVTIKDGPNQLEPFLLK